MVIWERGSTRLDHAPKSKDSPKGLIHFGDGFCLLIALFIGVFSLVLTDSTYATATASTLTLGLTNNHLNTNIAPMNGGHYEESGTTSITARTDNFTGYTLKVIAQGNSTSLLSSNGGEIGSINSIVLDEDFEDDTNYINKWGYKPSQYVVSSGGINSTVMNTNNFLPAPNSLGDVLDITSAANAVDNTYTMSMATKADLSIPAGTYAYTYVVAMVANTITYNITYNSNSVETITNMPVPNPQAITIDGGTPAAQSYGTLSSAEPTMTTGDMRSFSGWCTVATTYNSATHNDECSGTVYHAGDSYPIDQTADGTNITLYAIWQTDPFPTVWSQTGKCVFNNGTISGSECQDYVNYDFIDTGIALYSNNNYQKDYEVHFTLDTYVPSAQPDSQSTMFNDKLSSSVTESPYGGKSPGIIVRKNSSNHLEIKSTYGAPTDHVETRYVNKTPPATAYAGTDVRIFRIDGIIYTSIDNGPLVFLQDYTSFNQQFGLSAWFGAYPDNVDCTENCTAAKRYFTGEMSNMYIKLGDMPSSNLLDITFNGNGGTPSTTAYKIINGNSLSELPEVTNSGWLFDGWWTASSGGQQITTATVPTATTTYYAHWYKSVTDAQITNTSIAMSVNDTETIDITNAADIEPYTLVSSDTSVATVNSSGVITAVGNGTATITLTGSKTGDTRTISVVVGTLISVDFDSQGGTPSSYTESVADGGSFSSLPEPTRTGYTLEGWYTGTNGTGTKLTTSTVFDTNTPTQYYAHWEEPTYVCKIAEANTLHTETCNQTGSNGCKGTSWPNNTITYGSVVDSSTLAAGNAFNCDINYDGTFDDETERFYYFGTENGNAKFVYYKSLQDTSALYDASIALLPTSSNPGWDNPNLVTFSTGDYNNTVARFMTYPEALALCDNASSNLGINGRCLYLLEKSAFANTNITDGIWLEKQPSYNNRIQTRSRGLTHGNTTSNAPRPTIEVPIEYVEPYIEPAATYEITFNPHNGGNNTTETVTAGTALGNKYPSPDPTYTDHIFQGWYTAVSGGTLVTDQTVPDGDWTYHAQWKGTVALAQVASNAITVVEGNTVPVSVTNASDLEAFTFSSNDTSVATVNPSTGVVTAVSDGIATISITGANSHASNNIVTITVVDASSSFRVTFDPQNGDSAFSVDVPAGNAIGAFMPQQDPTYANHAFIRWYDVSNDNTVTAATYPASTMTVYAEWKLDVTQAVIPNNDPTLAVGDQITIEVTNTSQLEPYTFSSDDTSIATINANTGVVTGVGAGTVNIIMTGTRSGLTKTIEVDVTPAPVIKRTVTFNANGGTTPTPSATYQIDDGTAVGSLPTTSRANYMFFGWYTDDGTFFEEVTPETIVDSDVTYYAKWVEDITSFPIIWAEVNACTFDGVHNVTGNYCSSENKTKKYIDTTKQLFTQANYNKDFEVGFTIVEYDPVNNSNQATFVNSKQENSANNYPGFVVRRYNSGDKIEVTEKWKDDNGVSQQILASSVHTVKIVRRIETINGTDHIIMYYSIDNGTLTPLQDITNVTHIFFDTSVWFGASATSNNTMQRPLVGTLTDMYVKLGVQTEYVINFDPGNGSFTNSSDSSRTIAIDDPLGNLPVPNPPSNNHTFVGWFDESTSPATQVTSSTVPTSNKTYVAHYSYQSSDTPVTFDVSNNATRGYQNLMDDWVQSPVNITTFNKATPINNSTWGDTSELSELEFWEEIRDNFVDNGCLIPSYSDAVKPLNALSAWTNGSVDCSKPDAYDTDIGAALTVRLNNSQGAVVSYAKADNGVIHNMIPGQTYYWEKSDDSTVYGYVTATSKNGTRWVDTGTIRNVRDLGGLPVTYTDGNNQTVTGTVAYGRLFRGEKLNSAPATELTNLGITTEYNVGDEYSSDTHLTDYHLNQVIHYDFDYNSGDENNSNSNYMKAWNAVTNIMTDITNSNVTKNVYFHCRVGADRTGTVAYLLEGLLGVPDEMRYEEYALTNVSGLYDRTRYYKQKASNNANKFVYMMGYVKTTQDIYDWYMQNPNASASLIQSFRTAMVDTGSGNRSLSNSLSGENNRSSGGSEENIEEESLDASSRNVNPLGVNENKQGEGDPSVGLAVAAVVSVVAGAAVSYLLAKQDDIEEE